MYINQLTTGTRSSATAEIASEGGRYTVQGHSRSLMLVPIKRPYATSYQLIYTKLHLSYTVFQLLCSKPTSQIIVFVFDNGVPPVNALILGNLCEYHRRSYIAKTRFFGCYIFVANSTSLFNYFKELAPKSGPHNCNKTKIKVK